MEFTPANSSPLWEGTHLSKDALVRWRNHTLSPAQVVAASEHLALCEQCRERLAAPSALLLLAQSLDNGGDEFALVRDTALQHLEFEQMEAFVDELLTPAGRRNVERHLARCEVCSAQVADLRAVQRELREWQTSPQILSEPVVVASVNVNGTAPHPVAEPESTSAPTAPPMRVAVPSASEGKKRGSWWDNLRNIQRYLLPLEAAGVAVTAVFLLLVVPYQRELARVSAKYDEIASEKAQVEAARSREQNRNKSRTEQLQNSTLQMRSKLDSLEKQNVTTQQQIRQLAKDKAALEEARRRDQERLAQRPPTSSTSEAPEPKPTSVPSNPASTSGDGVRIVPDGSNGSILVLKDGRKVPVTNDQLFSGDALRALSQGLQVPESVKALDGRAPASKEAESQLSFSLLYPVTTRIREVRPLLRWEAVPGADAYRVTLDDETNRESSPPQSDLLTRPQWLPTEPLIRGHRYSWRVEAFKQDKSTGIRRPLADAPRQPDSIARFEILTQAQEDTLRAQLGAVKDSPLQKSVVLAKAGVIVEAQQQLALVTGQKAPRSPKSP